MTDPSGDLDDQAEDVVDEVDAGNVAAIAADPTLCPRPRQSGVANQAQEAPFEHRLATDVQQQTIEKSDTVPSGTAQLGKTLDEHQRRRQVQPDGAVDGCGEAVGAGPTRSARSRTVRVADVQRKPSTMSTST